MKHHYRQNGHATMPWRLHLRCQIFWRWMSHRRLAPTIFGRCPQCVQNKTTAHRMRLKLVVNVMICTFNNPSFSSFQRICCYDKSWQGTQMHAHQFLTHNLPATSSTQRRPHIWQQVHSHWIYHQYMQCSNHQCLLTFRSHYWQISNHFQMGTQWPAVRDASFWSSRHLHICQRKHHWAPWRHWIWSRKDNHGNSWQDFNQKDNTNNKSALTKWYKTKTMAKLEQKTHDQHDNDNNDRMSNKNTRWASRRELVDKSSTRPCSLWEHPQLSYGQGQAPSS